MVFTLNFFLIAPSIAQEQDKEQKQSVQYHVYAGGIHALEANLNLSFSDDARYSSVLTAKTYGLLGRLAPWDGIFESHGWAGTINRPEMHQSTATWRGSEETKTYRYNKDTSFDGLKIIDDGKKKKVKAVDSKLTNGTTDILTSTLNTMQMVAAQNKCDGTDEVFDGKRRYKIHFKQKSEVILEASKWNVYSGPAVQCTVEVEPVAGAWHKKPRGWLSIQEQGRERGKIPTVWFAKVAEGKPAIPVKVMVKTSYGTLFMHMTSYDDGTKALTLKK